MNIVKTLLVAVLMYPLFMAGSCKKSENTITGTAPSNLSINAVVSTNGSGLVAFTATAVNAVTYDFEYGNGVIATVPSGIINYKYSLVGTNTFTVKVTAKSSDALTINKTIQVTVTVVAGTPILIWSDEFNTDGLPANAKWGYDIGNGSGGWGNNELQYYTSRSENAVVINGVLKITAQKETFSGSNFTSARLLSQNKFSFKYGKVEVRAKLPAGVGTWPAIWMLGDNISTLGWPACGEIDIMEHRGSELNKIFGTVHHPGHSGGNADGGTTLISNASTEFHVYSMEWTETSIKFLVDGQQFYAFANTTSLPFNKNFFILLNVAVGGSFAGPVDPAFNAASMEVDYVRVYQ